MAITKPFNSNAVAVAVEAAYDCTGSHASVSIVAIAKKDRLNRGPQTLLDIILPYRVNSPRQVQTVTNRAIAIESIVCRGETRRLADNCECGLACARGWLLGASPPNAEPAS